MATLPSSLMALLRCPATRQALEPAPQEIVDALNARIASGAQHDVGGRLVAVPIDAALMRADGALVYPVRGGVACLCAQDALPL
jgi:uncharacterized protein YbaR (Trm112 family)